MRKYKYKITGLDCANCALSLEEALKKIKGVEDLKLNFLTEKLILECQEEEKDFILQEIKKIVKKEEPDVRIEENE